MDGIYSMQGRDWKECIDHSPDPPPVVAFDVDGTLIGLDNKPRWDILDMLRIMNRYCRVIVWSGAGKDYARLWGRRLFLPDDVEYMEKPTGSNASICFDDQPVRLADINIRV
jgi:hypothetical protein